MKVKNKPAELPFTIEGNTASRALIRSNENIKNADGLYKVHLDIIRINPGFQPRQKPDGMLEELWEIALGIPDLADAIFENNGPIDPLLGDIYAEDGSFILTEGERRTRALRHLIATEREIYPDRSPVNIVKVILNPPGTTDKERQRIAISSGNKLPFTVMQRARYYQKFADTYDMTHQEIADFLSVSRQTVDNYILCLSLHQDIQDDLDADKVSISAALAAHRAAKKPTGTQVLVDTDSGEILNAGQEYKRQQEEKAAEKVSGDEDDFIQEDNSIKGTSSKGGPKGESSGSHVIGKDAIYMDGIKLAAWKQFVNRYEVVKREILMGATLENGHLNKWEEVLAERLKNEYNLTVK